MTLEHGRGLHPRPRKEPHVRNVVLKMHSSLDGFVLGFLTKIEVERVEARPFPAGAAALVYRRTR